VLHASLLQGGLRSQFSACIAEHAWACDMSGAQSMCVVQRS